MHHRAIRIGITITLFIMSGLMEIKKVNAHAPLLKAPTHPLDQRLDNCIKENPGTTSERHCMETLLPLWEARLLRYYALLGGDQNIRLKATQKTWLAYATDQTHYFEQKYDLQGTMYALFLAEARLQLIRHRVLQLEDDYDFLKAHR